MAKKKKSSLAPVNRGFATTSQAKKPVPIVEEPVEPEPVAEELKTTSSEGAKGDGVKKDGPKGNGQDDWEDEIGLEEGIYQGYVERLQEKGEKEINRIIKAIDFDKRMNKGYITLTLEDSLQEELFNLTKTTVRSQTVEPLKPTSNQQEKEKTLLKLYINYGVLTRIGWAEDKVLKCLEAIGEKGTWEDGLDWLLLNEKPSEEATGNGGR